MIEAQGPAAGCSKEPDLKEAEEEPEGVGDRAAGDKEPKAVDKKPAVPRQAYEGRVKKPGSSGILLITHQDKACEIRDVRQAIRRGSGRPRKERESAKEDGAKKERSDPDKGSVPDMETGCCLNPEGNGAGLGEVGEAGPGLPERGKDRQLEPSEDRVNMKKDEEEQPIQM